MNKRKLSDLLQAINKAKEIMDGITKQEAGKLDTTLIGLSSTIKRTTWEMQKYGVK